MAPTQPDLTPDAPEPDLSGASAWILTDGKAGDEGQCLAIADAVGVSPELRRVAPRAPFLWLMPWGTIDPREAPHRASSPIAPPYPDLVVASGRRAVPYLREIRRRSGGRCYTVFLKDPRTGPGSADLIWAPSYDRIRGPNVITTLTSPHRLSAARLAEARAHPEPRVAALPAPRAAVLVGGDSQHHRFTRDDTARFVRQLRTLAGQGLSLAVTTSRRTPEALATELRKLEAETSGFLWERGGDNPYATVLALADIVVVTADSANMVSEALSAGAPVFVFEPSGRGGRPRRLVSELQRLGAVKSFGGKLERFPCEKLDSTPVIAQAVARGFAAHRSRLAAGAAR